MLDATRAAINVLLETWIYWEMIWMLYRLRNNLKVLLVLVLSVFITYFGAWPQTLNLIEMHMREFIRDNLVLIGMVVAGAARAVYAIMILYIVVRCPEVAVLDLVIRRPLCMVEAYLNGILAWM
ncbi:hypothetical protein F5146DRAFT_529807 [Armillaria mellea]|nr:hypothetical protein F5146DRAFT_529807 [Armillaria mellea]